MDGIFLTFLIIQAAFVLIQVFIIVVMLVTRNKKAQQVEVRNLIGLQLDTALVQKQFEVGESFNCEGIIVKGFYSLAPHSQLMTDFEVTPPDMSAEGRGIVKVTCQGVSSAYAINVKQSHESALN